MTPRPGALFIRLRVVPFPIAPMAPGCVSPSSFPLLELDARVKLEQIGRERISNTVRYEIASRMGPDTAEQRRAERGRGDPRLHRGYRAEEISLKAPAVLRRELV